MFHPNAARSQGATQRSVECSVRSGSRSEGRVRRAAFGLQAPDQARPGQEWTASGAAS